MPKSPEYLAKVRPKEGAQFTTKGSPTRGDLKTEFRKLALASSDIHDAYSACRHLLAITNNPPPELPRDKYTEMRHPLYFPLLHAIAVSYAKPFTHNETVGVLKKEWGKFSDPKLQAAHEDLLDARNKIFAHSDALKRQITIHPPGTTPLFRGRPNDGIGYGIATEWFSIVQIRTFERLTYDLCQRLQAEVERLLELLYGGMELPTKKFKLRVRGEDDDGF